MKTLVINLFGAPGAGKSTSAATVFASLKRQDIDAELVTEFAKDKVWEENTEVFKNQIYILGKQYFKLTRCIGKVRVIVTDSPIELSSYYNSDPAIEKDLKNLVMNVSNSITSIDFFLNRVKKYNPNGRYQTEEESDKVSVELKNFLDENEIAYTEVDGNEAGSYKIVLAAITKLKEMENEV